MITKVMYHTVTGNTELVAASIASAAGVRSEAISESTSVGVVDLLFLGDGEYDKKPADVTLNFIARLVPDKVKQVAVFGTFRSNKCAIDEMVTALKKRGIKVYEETFGCKGKYGVIFNSKHPDDNDLNGAIQFANKAIAKAKMK